MIEELKNVLEGKTTLIKNVQYLSAKAYIEPFITRLKPLCAEFVCQVKLPDQVSITNGQPDLVYNRVHIQAILPKSYYDKEDCQKVVGMIYGLDTKNPVAKFYIANINSSGNIITFDQNALAVQEIEAATPLVYSSIQTLLERADNTETMIHQLKNSFVERDRMIKLLGEWIDYTLDGSFSNESGKIKLATSIPIDVYKSIVKDKDSNFYIPEEKEISLYHVYNCFLTQIKNDDKDIMNRFEKTILVNRLLKIQ